MFVKDERPTEPLGFGLIAGRSDEFCKLEVRDRVFVYKDWIDRHLANRTLTVRRKSFRRLRTHKETSSIELDHRIGRSACRSYTTAGGLAGKFELTRPLFARHTAGMRDYLEQVAHASTFEPCISTARLRTESRKSATACSRRSLRIACSI